MSGVRIAMVSEHASPLASLGGVDAGGQNVHVRALASTLADRGHDVVVHTRRDHPDLDRTVALSARVTVDHVDAGPPTSLPKDELFPHMDRFAHELVDRWSVCPPDVVHSHFWMSGYAARLACAALDLPLVHTFHALGVVKRRHQGSRDPSPPQRLGEERRLVAEVDRIVATCTDEAFELMRMGASAERISIVPCGVDTALFTPDGPTEVRGARFRLVVIGRVVERKGVGNAIEALARVPDTELVVAGGPAPAALASDPEVRRLCDLAARHGVADRVVLRGALPRHLVPPLLRSADAVVCVPWYEPFGIVPLEAMACGTPVVGSAVGGLVDTVVDGVTGLLVPPRDPNRLGEAIAELLASHPTVRREMGEAGVRRARERYTWQRVGRATDEVYRSLVPAGRTLLSHSGQAANR